jgi:hypothetical protein
MIFIDTDSLETTGIWWQKSIASTILMSATLGASFYYPKKGGGLWQLFNPSSGELIGEPFLEKAVE